MKRKENSPDQNEKRVALQDRETKNEGGRRGRHGETKRIVEIDGENLPAAMKLFMRVYSEP